MKINIVSMSQLRENFGQVKQMLATEEELEKLFKPIPLGGNWTPKKLKRVYDQRNYTTLRASL